MAALNHPNILTIFHVGHDGTPYLVTELLEGHSLKERLDEGPLPFRKAVDCVRQIAEGLAAAHARGVIHRDLKPANVFVTKDGRVKILDFGLAKLTEPIEPGEATISRLPTRTEAGRVTGTVGYMSPEQLRGRPVDPRSDILALGAVLYEVGVVGARRSRSVASDLGRGTLTRGQSSPLSDCPRQGRS